MISLQNVSYAIKDKIIVSDISLEIPEKKCIALLGPNGAGKSTLLQLIAGSLTPSKGKILLNSKPLNSFSIAQLARHRAVLSQFSPIHVPIKVQDLIALGRYAYAPMVVTASDWHYVTQQMERMQIAHLANRYYHTLSGGEAQLVQLCRVVVQLDLDNFSGTPKFLLLDEPVSNLDVQYQHAVLQMAKSLVPSGVSIVAILHDINLDLEYAEEIHLIKKGCLFKTLTPQNPLSAEDIKEVYQVEAELFRIGAQQQNWVRTSPLKK
jgi:iron complex transport system ATP-binding protein